MKFMPTRRTIPAALIAGLVLAVTVLTSARPAAQSVAAKQTVSTIERALQRLPYYGVFDFLAFSVDRGIVTLHGYAYQGGLKSAATKAVKRVSGVEEVDEHNRRAAGVAER